MITNCMECGKEIEYEEYPNIFGIDSSLFKPSICSVQCEARIYNKMALEVNRNVFRRILTVLPEAYKSVKMEDFKNMELRHVNSWQKNPTTKKATDIISKFCNSNYWNITFASENYGNGKTRLSLYIMACLGLKGIYRTKDIGTVQDAGYYSALDIVKLLKTETFDVNQFNLKRFYRAKVLLIDDLGQEDKRDSGEIAGILKIREENNLKTIITTNLKPSHMEERYTGRISSRIAKGVFNVIGGDYRK